MTEPGGTVPAESGGSWWQRRTTWQKVLIIVGAVVVGLMVLGAIFGEPEASDGAANSAATTGVAQSDDTTDATTTTTESGLPGVGDAVRDGKFEFVATSIEQPGTEYQPPGAFKDVANGQWFVVHMTVENIGDAEQTFFAGNQRILWDGKEFGGETLTWNGTNADDLNPGLTVDATVLFDLPASFPAAGAGSMLELHDPGFSAGVNVHL